MNRDDIIRMAREAGIDAESDTLCRYEGWVEPLQRFFHLAAAAGAAAEREECAQIADEWATREQKQFGNGGPGAAIRARGKE